VVKAIWRKTASAPQTDGSIVFARRQQCALPCWHIGATWRIWLNLCFLRPTQVHNPNGKSIDSAISAQLTVEVPILYNGRPFPKNFSFSLGIWTPSNSWFLESTIQTASQSFQPFSQRRAAECPCTLQWAAPFPITPSNGGSGPHLAHDSLGPSEHCDRFTRFCTDDRKVSLYFTMGRLFPHSKLPLPMGIWAPSNTWFSGPTRVLNPNGISIGSAVFALTSVTDRQTTLLGR